MMVRWHMQAEWMVRSGWVLEEEEEGTTLQ